MKSMNQQFLEAYKRLDKLCQEVLGTDKGITAYIDEMKDSVGGIIPGWAEDLKMLKELRHIRNMLSHDVGTFDQNVCDIDDVEWLEDFRDRLMKGNDPLGLLHKTAKKAKAPTTKVVDPIETKSPRETLTGGDIAKLILRLAIAGGIVWLLLKYVFKY